MTAALVVAALFAVVVLLNRRFHFDADPGGYKDGPTTTATFPDKGVHLIAAALLVLAACALGVPPLVAALLVILAGAAFEWSQGFVSYFDIAADAVGAILAMTLWLLTR